VFNVAIVGYGVAGIAASILLRDQGHEITHFESRSSGATVGAGILLQPKGLRALESIGLLDEVLLQGSEISRIFAATTANERLLDVSYIDVGASRCAIGLQRAALAEILARADAGRENVKFDHEVEHIDPRLGVITTAQGKFERFDLIIIADGSNSSLRDRTMPHHLIHNKLYETSALVALLPDRGEAPSPTVSQQFDGTRHVSAWPVGRNHFDQTRQIALAVNVFSENEFKANPAHWFRCTVSRICPQLGEQLATMSTLKPIHFRYRDVQMHRYVYERVVVIGDAAHAMSPQLGLGATLALTDAVAFAKCMQSTRSVKAALQEFDRSRRPLHAPIQSASRLLTPIMQSNSVLLAAIRNRTLKAANSSQLLSQQFFSNLI
jgi:2-polyprenyl-6-methoxyphenol hydroxylase-like FAD-dependent oxidoreductase